MISPATPSSVRTMRAASPPYEGRVRVAVVAACAATGPVVGAVCSRGSYAGCCCATVDLLRPCTRAVFPASNRPMQDESNARKSTDHGSVVADGAACLPEALFRVLDRTELPDHRDADLARILQLLLHLLGDVAGEDLGREVVDLLRLHHHPDLPARLHGEGLLHAGWMRPSDTSFSSVSRATSRRTGSKQLSTTASGVSSMMRFTPVRASNARMFRPSRPMIRPFMSSLGSGNTLTVDSAVCSLATRWMAIVTILRARSSPSSRARCSSSRTRPMAWRLASSTIVFTSD